ncbi:hypothetical protein [Cryptosporangium minutisporangium]|uniref:Uncharacterized protein n=1 Tax=Cryptosporangium minutisporangium TaxID=113569 RepID=A0ABP6SXA0_9ACTN
MIAEGLYWLLDDGRDITASDVGYWRAALERRRCFLIEVRHRVLHGRIPAGKRRRMLAALDAAERARGALRADDCAAYVRAWRRDLERWAERLERRSAGAAPRPAIVGVEAATGGRRRTFRRARALGHRNVRHRPAVRLAQAAGTLSRKP